MYQWLPREVIDTCVWEHYDENHWHTFQLLPGL